MSNKKKFIIGLIIWITGNLLFFLSPLIIASDLPVWIRTILGSLLVFSPEIGALIAVSIMGKENFQLIINKIKSWLRYIKPAGNIGKVRHIIGLILFFIPLFPSYVIAYAPSYLPDTSPGRIWVCLASDIVFFVSLFVLGGDFWDKLRALFTREARAVFPPVKN